MTDLLERINAVIAGSDLPADSFLLSLDPTTAALARQALRTALYGGRMPEGGRRVLFRLIDALGALRAQEGEE